MIEPKNERQVRVSGNFETSSFSIGGDGLAHIFELLRNGIYPNAPRAILRELGCNARDSHVEAGCGNRPFHVQLPNTLYPVFKIRDFGTGMTHDRVMKQYSSYGESTKRGSNDFIGQLGIGSKSPFAYCSAFIVHSYLNGEKRSYSCYIDETEIGKISFIGAVQTDEENGLEIEFPVKSQDIHSFVKEAGWVYQWFDLPPKIFGHDLVVQPLAFNFGDFDINPSRYSGHYAVMGAVPYKFERHELLGGDRIEDLKIENLLDDSTYVKMDIGTLQFTPSREEVKYTNFTKTNLRKRLLECHDKLIESLQKEFDSIDKNYLAKRWYHEKRSSSRRFFDSLNFGKFKNISSSNWLNPFGVEKIITFSKGSRKKPKRDIENFIPSSEDSLVVFAKNFDDRKILNHVGDFLNSNQNQFGKMYKYVYVVIITDQGKFDQWAKDYDFDLPMVDIHTLPYKTLTQLGYIAKKVRTGPSNVNPKFRKNVFLFDPDGYDKDSMFLEDEEFDFDLGGCYFEINKFDLVDNRISLDNFKSVLNEFSEEMGIDQVRAVKSGMAKKFKDSEGWTNVFDLFVQFAAKNRKKIMRDIAIRSSGGSGFYGHALKLGVDSKLVGKFKVPKSSKYGDFCFFLNPKDQLKAKNFGGKISQRNVKVEKAIKDRYKLLNFINPYYYDREGVKEYVALVDKNH